MVVVFFRFSGTRTPPAIDVDAACRTVIVGGVASTSKPFRSELPAAAARTARAVTAGPDTATVAPEPTDDSATDDCAPVVVIVTTCVDAGAVAGLTSTVEGSPTSTSP